MGGSFCVCLCVFVYVAEKLRRWLCNQKIAGSNPASGHLSLQKGDLSWILSASAIKLLQFTVIF